MTCIVPVSAPPAILGPNRPGSPYLKRQAKNAQRKEAAKAASVVLRGATPRWTKARYFLRCYVLKRWDDDNMIAALKGARDGLVDAGLLADDKCLKLSGAPAVEFIEGTQEPHRRVEFHVFEA
jgi:hypothetical protein